MKFINLNNTRITKYLQNITDFLYSEKISKHISKARPMIDSKMPSIDPVSDEYFYKAFNEFNHKDYGFPLASHGYSMLQFTEYNLDISEEVKRHTSRIGKHLGTHVSALIMAYPDNGYIGWHHNGNAPGYNVLITYSQDGDGWFKYYDYETKSIVTMPDKKGWSVKVGYYPSIYKKEEKDKLYWHCAKTQKQRITCAWVVPDRDIWINMIEEITGGDFDTSTLVQDHMPLSV